MTLFKHGALTNRKWPVHPESTIDVSCGLIRGWVRQTSNIELYLKLSPLNIIPCCIDYLPCYPLEWPPFCGRVSGVYK
jgi:hypothetical protein